MFCLCSLAQAIEIKPGTGYEVVMAGYWVSDETDIQQVTLFNDWHPREVFKIPTRQSHLWLKADIHFRDSAINGVYISSLASFELYWEKQLLYRAGQVGDKNTPEIPGQIDNFILLPQTISTGHQSFYLRVSRDHLPAQYRHSTIDFTLNDYQSLLQQKTQQSLFPLLSLGALLVISIYYLSVYHSQRYQPYQLFSLLCLVVALWLLAENWRPLFGYSWHWHGTRLWLISILSGIFGMLLPLFMAREFRLPIPRFVWALQIPVFILLHSVVSSFDLITGLFVLQGFILSLLIVVWARVKGNLAANWTILALTIALLPVLFDPTDYLEQWFFVLFPVVIVALLHNLSLTMRALKVSREQAIAMGKSLQLQLLKKSIQPHFLLNTLTSLSEWIETSPNTAQEMVAQLADEFYLLGTMVDKPLVTIAAELQLCQTHLRLMSLRKNCQFNLLSTMFDSHISIPPGTLHTLIENAFSHNIFKEGKFVFEVTQRIDNAMITLSVACPKGSSQSVENETNDRNSIHHGTGTEYIQQRMQQAFGEQWSLTETPTSDNWLTTIIFPVTTLAPQTAS